MGAAGADFTLTALLERSSASPWPLPEPLAARYGGPLGFPAPAGRPYVVANFVTTLDGVVSYALPGQAGGGPISGFSAADRFVMGLLRACADAVVVGAGTVRQARPDHVWNADYVFPAAAAEYAQLRRALGRTPQPVTVVVTGSGRLSWERAAFRNGTVPVVVATTPDGAGELRAAGELPPGVRVEALSGSDAALSAGALLAGLDVLAGARLVLVEGGPKLFATFVAEHRLDELFLTLAPQIAGRDHAHARPALVEGAAFLPSGAPWARLVSARSAGEHLFLRYAF